MHGIISLDFSKKEMGKNKILNYNQLLICLATRTLYVIHCYYSFIFQFDQSKTATSTNRYIRIDQGSGIETLSISDIILQYVVLTNNNYGSNASGGLIRISFKPSVVEYISIFSNSGSYLVTFYEASCSISHCYTNERQSQFSGCTLGSDFNSQCYTYTEYQCTQSICPTYMDQSYPYQRRFSFVVVFPLMV